MTTTSLSIPSIDIDIKRAFQILAFLWLSVLIAMVAIDRPLYIGAVVALPVLFWLLVSPKTTFYIYLFLVPIYYPFRLSGFAVWGFDVAMLALGIGLVVEKLLHDRLDIRRTPFDLPLIALMLATWLSALLAFSGRDTIVPSFRILSIVVAFRAVFTMTVRLGVRRIVLLYILIVFALSVINIVLFAYYGGAVRVFGPAGLAFEAYAMTALPMALAFFIWSDSRRGRFWYGVIAAAITLAIFASGSRGTLLAVGLGVPCLLILAWKRSLHDRSFRFGQAVFPLLVIAGIVAVVVTISSSSLYGLFLARVGEMAESVDRPVGTIELRLVLWTAAFKAWLTSPLVGIGIGNFGQVDQIVPQLKMAPVWYYIKGMSAHNVVLHYLAETGLIGLIALLSVPYAGLKTVRLWFRRPMNAEDTQVSMALTIAVIVFAMSLFFMRAWTWAQEGHVMAMILGMTAAWHYRQSSEVTHR